MEKTELNYFKYLESVSDPRTRGWFLVDSIFLNVSIIIGYLIVVFAGPKIMAKYRPFDLKKTILYYNLILAFINGYICMEIYKVASIQKYTWLCSSNDTSLTGPHEMWQAKLSWSFHMLKFIELLDTLFFILRKKNKQLSFLHVYHHSLVIILSTTLAKWFPVGVSYIPVMINAGVHFAMYLYYGLSTLGPKYAKYLWWKKYLTVLQIVQFIIAITLQIASYASGCQYVSRDHAIFNVVLGIIFFLLFGHFYLKSYKQKRNDEQVKQR